MNKAFDEGDPALVLASLESKHNEPRYSLYPKFQQVQSMAAELVIDSVLHRSFPLPAWLRSSKTLSEGWRRLMNPEG
jgi:hypothetical protein